jgi:hypothetical protein
MYSYRPALTTDELVTIMTALNAYAAQLDRCGLAIFADKTRAAYAKLADLPATHDGDATLATLLTG